MSQGPDAATGWVVDALERQRRRVEVERSRSRTAPPGTEVRVAIEQVIAAPASAVWVALTDADRAAELLEFPPILACTVPGTPVATVGELSCVAVLMPDGALRGGVEETLLREEGRRLVSRGRSEPIAIVADWTLEPAGPDACTARVVLTAAPPSGAGWLVKPVLHRGWRAGLQRLRRAVGDPTVAGEPEPRLPLVERWTRRRSASAAARLARGPRSDVTVARALDLPLGPEQIWGRIAVEGSPAVERGGPATCFSPTGGPPEPTGLRAVLGPHPTDDLQVRVEEWVDVDPGRRLAARDVAAFGPRAVVTLAASGAGCRIVVRLNQEVLPRDAGVAENRLGRRAEAYLDRLGRAVTGMPPLPLEEAWVG